MSDLARRAAALLLLVSLTAPTMVGAQTRPSASTSLAEALAYVSSTTDSLLFTDWAAIKSSHGLEILDSSLPEELRFAAMLDLTRQEAIYASFGLGRLDGHAKAWGWDSTDLEWEANLLGNEGVFSVLRFRDGFDLAPFVTRLDERGFDTSTLGAAVIRSHPMDFEVDWLLTTDLAILNLALLPDGRTILASSSPDTLAAALAPRDQASAAVVAADAGSLSAIHSAFLETSFGSCTAYDPRVFPDTAEANEALLAEVLPLGAWETLTLLTGRDQDDAPLAELRLTFPLDEDQDLDAEAERRGRLAREGDSLRIGRPYAEVAFTTSDVAWVDGRITLALRPIEDTLRRFTDAVFARDLLPAMCGA